MMDYSRNLICKHCVQMVYCNLEKVICSNGNILVAFYHNGIEYPHRATDWLSKAALANVDTSKLTVHNEYTPLNCEVCGESFAEVHHWLPRHIDPENCWRWPTGNLCRKCHMEWHAKVTPNMCEVA